MSGGDDVLWDDAAFKQRIVAACKLRGIEIKDLLTAAGASVTYLKKSVDGRSTNVVMKLARELRIPPEELAFGVIAEKGVPTLGMSVAELLDAAALRQVMARMFTAQQVMALMCLATNQQDTNRETVNRLMLDAAQQHPQKQPTVAPADHGAEPENAAASAIKLGNEAK